MILPFGIKSSGEKWVVYNKDTGRVLGTHESMAGAQKQLKAVHANVPEHEQVKAGRGKRRKKRD